MAYVVDKTAIMLCPHGGKAQLSAGSTRVTLSGQPPLRQPEGGSIVGCAFAVIDFSPPVAGRRRYQGDADPADRFDQRTRCSCVSSHIATVYESATLPL